MRLQLSYPTKPYIVTQAWGVPNEAYRQFGFWKHNGIDFTVDTDGKASAMCDGIVTETGYNDGAGNYVKYRTDAVEAEGQECHVWFFYMHAKELLVKIGDKVTRGQDIIIADNTGFSTGPHTHISARRYTVDERIMLDTDPATNYTFDFSKYYDGTYPDGTTKVETIDHNLKFGDRDDEVRKLQIALRKQGFFKYPEITGYYGSITKQAVYDFQIASGVISSGFETGFGTFCGPKTRQRLNALI